MLAHAAGDVGGNNVTIVQLNAKHGVRQVLENRAFHFYMIFFGHRPLGVVERSASLSTLAHIKQALGVFAPFPSMRLNYAFFP